MISKLLGKYSETYEDICINIIIISISKSGYKIISYLLECKTEKDRAIVAMVDQPVQ